LPQILDDLHDIHVAPGAPLAKFHLKVKGERSPQHCLLLQVCTLAEVVDKVLPCALGVIESWNH